MKYSRNLELVRLIVAEPEPIFANMRAKLPMLISVAILASAIMLLFRDELLAHGPRRLNRPAATTECGFWGDMSAGMSCR
jgi:hypothetical protein